VRVARSPRFVYRFILTSRGARVQTIRIHRFGGPEVLQAEDRPIPDPGPGEVVIEVEAAGVNFLDVYHRTGLYPGELPLTLGREAAGTVARVGEGVTTCRAGDRVVTETARGAYAEYALAAAERVVPIPDRVTSRQAAAVLLQGMTAHYLAEATYHLTRGDTCLVHAAAGGVGLLLCQIARRMGARVIGTVSTDEKAALARDAGADEVILYTRTDFLEETRRLTGGAGVQVVYDSVGRTTFLKSLDALALRGMLVLYGQSSGPVEPFDPQLLNRKGSLFLTRPTLVHYTATREELLQRAGEVLGWVADGALEVRIGKELPLAQAAEAHHELEGRRTTCKVLLVP
jgi:NADPH2:quinone reductase